MVCKHRDTESVNMTLHVYCDFKTSDVTAQM